MPILNVKNHFFPKVYIFDTLLPLFSELFILCTIVHSLACSVCCFIAILRSRNNAARCLNHGEKTVENQHAITASMTFRPNHLNEYNSLSNSTSRLT